MFCVHKMRSYWILCYLSHFVNFIIAQAEDNQAIDNHSLPYQITYHPLYLQILHLIKSTSILQQQSKMEQQLLEQIIEIKPTNMHEILTKITSILQNSSEDTTILLNIAKSLFHGLWNFDKMINQHNLSTAIAEMLGKVGENVGFALLKELLGYIHSKYNLIDKHRINKFMQLVRYLLKKGLQLSHKKTDNLLKEIIFNDLSGRIGIAYHITQIYFQLICEVVFAQSTKSKKPLKELPLKKLSIFEEILQKQNTLEHLRYHILEHIYEKYKTHIVQVYIDEPEDMEAKLEEVAKHFMEMAQNQQKDQHRKNLYTLVGYLKSDEVLFRTYILEKQEKAEREKQKRKKKISKHKKKIIKEAKTKRKQLKKKNKKPEVISKRKFQIAAQAYRQ